MHVDTTTIDRGETLTGIVPWRVRTKGAAARRVDFLIDGRGRLERLAQAVRVRRRPRLEHDAASPTARTSSTVRAIGGGRSAAQRLAVDVVNRDFALTTSALHAWQKVKGVLRDPRERARRAGRPESASTSTARSISRDRAAPYTLRWNSQRVARRAAPDHARRGLARRPRRQAPPAARRLPTASDRPCRSAEAAAAAE